MGWTKKKLVLKALGAMALVEYDGTDVQPEMLQDGLSSLDAMMAQWDSEGIRLGYPQSDSPDSIDPNQDSGIPQYAIRAVYTNLAMELAPSLGKEVSPRVAEIASKSREALGAFFGDPVPYRQPLVAAGAGHRRWYTGFSILDLTAEEEEEGLESGPDTVDSRFDFE